jgi:hypothetical protein
MSALDKLMGKSPATASPDAKPQNMMGMVMKLMSDPAAIQQIFEQAQSVANGVENAFKAIHAQNVEILQGQQDILAQQKEILEKLNNGNGKRSPRRNGDSGDANGTGDGDGKPN